MCLLSSAHSFSNQIQNANLNFLVFIGLGLIWGWWRNHVSEYLQYLLPETHSSPQRILFQGSFISYTIRFQYLDVRLVIALVKQGSALLACGWVTARLIYRWHFPGLVAVASNACEVTLWIDFHGRGLNET